MTIELAVNNKVRTVSATSDNSAYDPNNIKDFTFDDNWQSNGSVANAGLGINLDVEANGQYDYVGISGHNIGTLGGEIEITNNGVLDVDGFVPVDNRPLMFKVPRRTGGGAFNCIVTVKKQNVSDILIITHIAVGDLTDFGATLPSGQVTDNSYQSAFARVPMNYGVKTRTVVNDQAAPTALLRVTTSQSISLSVPNLPVEFAKVDLLSYQSFWTKNAFFGRNDGDETQTYMLFDFFPSARTSGKTRELINVSYKAKTYNGLS